VKNIDTVGLIYVFIEFIISDNTSYTYRFVFISPLDDKKLEAQWPEHVSLTFHSV